MNLQCLSEILKDPLHVGSLLESEGSPARTRGNSLSRGQHGQYGGQPPNLRVRPQVHLQQGHKHCPDLNAAFVRKGVEAGGCSPAVGLAAHFSSLNVWLLGCPPPNPPLTPPSFGTGWCPPKRGHALGGDSSLSHRTAF